MSITLQRPSYGRFDMPADRLSSILRWKRQFRRCSRVVSGVVGQLRSAHLLGRLSLVVTRLYVDPFAGWAAVLACALAGMLLTYGGVAAVLAVAVALLAAGLVWNRMRPLQRSLEAIDDAALRIAEGETSVRVPSSSGSARIAGLIDRFNMMAETLDSRATRRRVVAAGVSHEIRTPLTILKGRLHAIEDGVIRLDEHETQRLMRQVDHVLRIVDDFGTLEKADDGPLALDLEPVDLERIVTPAVSDLVPLVGRHGLKISQAARRTMVVGDPVRLAQIVTNLVTNAAKHSRPGGEVQVSVGTEGNEAVIRVLDAGPGFAEADRHRLFQPFWRSADDQRSGCPGSGIGLTLTAALVRAHGGRLSAENRPGQQGACFCVILPLAA